MISTIRGQQLRDQTIARAKIDPAFEAGLALIESNVQTIFDTMSTDSERLAAIAAVTAAWEAADGNLQTMITNMVNATKAGAGLETDGSFVLPVGQNYLTGATTLKGAIGLLDSALKTEETARIAAVSGLQTSIQAIIDAGGAEAAADLADEVAARIAGDAANATAITNETADRVAADADLQTQITNEVAARSALNTTLSDSIAAEAAARTAAVSAEATTRAAADTALQSAIDAEALARTTADAVHTAAISDEAAARTAADTAEAAARVAADEALDARVDTLEAATANQLTYAKVVTRELPAGLINGVNTDFTIANDCVADTEQVFYNGVLQVKGETADYTMIGKVVTLNFAPDGSDSVRVSYFR